MFGDDPQPDKGYDAEAQHEATETLTTDGEFDPNAGAEEEQYITRHDGDTEADGTAEALEKYDILDVTPVEDPDLRPAGSDAETDDSRDFDPFAEMDDAERCDTSGVRDALNPFVNWLLYHNNGEVPPGGQDRRHPDTSDDPRATHTFGDLDARDEELGESDGQELRPSSGQMGRAKVEANAPEDPFDIGPDTHGRLGVDDVLDTRPEEVETCDLVGQEKAVAREWEIERTHRRSADDRAERTREVVEGISKELGYYDRPDWHDEPPRPVNLSSPTITEDEVDVPLGDLDPELQEQAARQAARIMEVADDWYSAVDIQQKLGDRLRDGQDLPTAVSNVHEKVKTAPGVTAIEDLGSTNDWRVTISGTITVLWEADENNGIAQVGRIEDDTGETKFTLWESACGSGLTTDYDENGYTTRHNSPIGRFEVGDEVTFEYAKRKFYQGRPLVELDRQSFKPDRMKATRF